MQGRFAVGAVVVRELEGLWFDAVVLRSDGDCCDIQYSDDANVERCVCWTELRLLSSSAPTWRALFLRVLMLLTLARPLVQENANGSSTPKQRSTEVTVPLPEVETAAALDIDLIEGSGDNAPHLLIEWSRGQLTLPLPPGCTTEQLHIKFDKATRQLTVSNLEAHQQQTQPAAADAECAHVTVPALLSPQTADTRHRTSLQATADRLSSLQLEVSAAHNKLQEVQDSISDCLEGFDQCLHGMVSSMDSDAIMFELGNHKQGLSIGDEALQSGSTHPAASFVRTEASGEHTVVVVQLPECTVRLRAGSNLGTGQQQWLSGCVLARWMSCHQELVAGSAVLELGSGLGLCGIVASHLGADRVLCSDVARVLPLLRHNVNENCAAAAISVHELQWGSDTVLSSCQLLLCADLLYSVESLPLLLRTLELNTTADGCKVVFAYQTRDAAAETGFFSSLAGIGFETTVESDFDTLGAAADMVLCTSMRMAPQQAHAPAKSVRYGDVVPVKGSIVPLVNSPLDMAVPYLIKIAAIGARDVVVELGCGEGGVAIGVAQQCGVRVIGVDIQPEYVDLCRVRSEEANVSHLASFMVEDFTHIDMNAEYIKEATVLYLFLLPCALQLLKPLIRDCIALKKKVVTFQYHLNELGFKPQKEDLMGMIRLY